MSPMRSRNKPGSRLDRKEIEVEGVKTVGSHTAVASLHRDVSFPITLEVVAAE